MLLEINGGKMLLLSTAFGNFDEIPSIYTAEGEDISPPLRWQDFPQETKTFALICDDPDAPNKTWDHWLLYNIPRHACVLAPGVKQLPSGTFCLKNSWGNFAYGGPNPPSGMHRYYFTVYALKTVLQLKEDATKDDLKDAMRHQILDEAVLIGTYELKNK